MAYASWRKGGEVLSACRVVGLACEMLCKAECDLDGSRLATHHCAVAEFWETEKLHGHDQWEAPKTCLVPVREVHRELALYLVQRLYGWISGLGLCVAGAVVAKTVVEGTGHHDLKLRHAMPKPPFYCQGFISMELKVSQVGRNGAAFSRSWEAVKKSSLVPMGRVLKASGSAYGACLLLLVGVCDGPELLDSEPPLLVKAQLVTLDAGGEPKWTRVVLDRGTVPTEPVLPKPKKQRRGASWDEVRASLHGKQAVFADVAHVRLLDLFRAISASKTVKNPGQKVETYKGHLHLAEGRDFMRKRLLRYISMGTLDGIFAQFRYC